MEGEDEPELFMSDPEESYSPQQDPNEIDVEHLPNWNPDWTIYEEHFETDLSDEPTDDDLLTQARFIGIPADLDSKVFNHFKAKILESFTSPIPKSTIPFLKS